MNVQTKVEAVIVRVWQAIEGLVAEISFTQDGQPQLSVRNKAYKKEITKIFEELTGMKELSVLAEPFEETLSDGTHDIHDRVRLCKSGDADYPYALAHQLSNYTLNREPLIGTVVTKQQ